MRSKVGQLIEIYFEEAHKNRIEQIVDIALSGGFPQEGEIITKEHIDKTVEILATEVTRFMFRAPSEVLLDKDELQ